MIRKYWTWITGALATGATIIGTFFIYDKAASRAFTAWEDRSIAEQIYEFERSHVILRSESMDGQTRLTYRTCYAPAAVYDLDFIVNGRPMLVFKDINPAAFGKFYTQHCQTYTGQWLDFELEPGDLLSIRYDYGEYGVIDIIYIKPE